MTSQESPSGPGIGLGRSARVEVDLAAIAHNVAVLASRVAPAKLMAVVKADGYGHGALRVAETALSSGAESLAVALVGEGTALRRAGIEVPILVLSEQPESQIDDIVAHRLTATVYSDRYIEAIAHEARRNGVLGMPVHLKIDTGMNRVGVHPSQALARVEQIAACEPHLALDGVYTHFASADELGSPRVSEQLQTLDSALSEIRRAGMSPGSVHAANSAAALVLPETHRDLVRAGIAIYGIAPNRDLEEACIELRPALAVKAEVSFVKQVAAGEWVSYGSRYRCSQDTTIVTVPIGYADGVPRRAGLVGMEVLIGGRRHPIVGVVTMDQLMVDVGNAPVSIGDEVVIIGSQGHESISVDEVAARLDTIGYEVVCGLSARLPRHHEEV